jgi:hypothetical protein
MGDLELLTDGDRALHSGQIRIASHNDADLWLFHIDYREY